MSPKAFVMETWHEPSRSRYKWALALTLQAAVLLVALICAPSHAAGRTTLVVLGDSLVAGYGLAESDAFPARLEAALAQAGRDVNVINAGVSGDTSAGGLARLDWSVPEGADAVLVELGANDALRGIAPEQTEANLDRIVARLKERGIAVLVAGMLAPPNMGSEYESRFNPIFTRVTGRHGAMLYPFFLDGVAAVPSLNLADAMHPNEQGVAEIVRRILPVVEQFLDEHVETASR